MPVIVSLADPQGRYECDLELPEDIALRDLLPDMLDAFDRACGRALTPSASRCGLRVRGGPALRLDETLDEADIWPGTALEFTT